MDTEIIIGLIALASSIAVAIIAHLGRKAETSAEKTRVLIEGYATRVEQLEERQDKLEAKLDATRKQLHWHQRHALALRRALAGAIEWIADAVEWINGPRRDDPPSPPDSDPWKALITAVADDLDP